MSKFTVVSLFAGCGGSSLGYRMAGGKVLLAVEWDKAAAESYRRNAAPGTRVLEGDVCALPGEEALRLAGVAQGELDVLDGSPPCQGFSTAGKRKVSDPRNDLFRQFVRLLGAFRPRAFVMENVSGLVKGRMKPTFVEMLRALRAEGYDVKARLLDAQFFGVPQRRERVIFVGARLDLGAPASHPKAQRRPLTLRQVLPSLGGNPALVFGEHGGEELLPGPAGRGSEALRYEGETAWNPPRVVSDEPSPTLRAGSVNLWIAREAQDPPPPALDDAYGELWEAVPKGKRAYDVLRRRGQQKGWGSCVKLHPDQPSRTLPKEQTGRGFMTFVHPLEKRALTIAEAKVIASFPPGFELAGDYRQQWARIGNSVPPLLMRAVAEHVRDEVLARQRRP